MQTFLRSHSGSSRSIGNTVESTAGFTLVELLISIAIITILSAVVIAKFSIFDSTTLLKSMAYEVATNLRETQVFAVSVKGSDPQFDYPFGMTFTPNMQSYKRFQYQPADPQNDTSRPYYDVSGTFSNDIATFDLQRSIEVSNICEHTTGTWKEIDRLDISFRRPEFGALFNANKDGSDYTELQNSAIETVLIRLNSPNGTGNGWNVLVGVAGHITVCRQGDPSCDITCNP